MSASATQGGKNKSHIDNRKKVVKQQYLPHMCSQYDDFGPMAAEIRSLVWATPANFNGFRVLASLLQRRPSTEANQTLHDVWPSPGLVHYIYIYTFSGAHAPLQSFARCKIHFAKIHKIHSDHPPPTDPELSCPCCC